MLKHEDNPELSSLPAAQVRVTPQELAQALSRIEARKDAGQRNVDGTISIGEAIQQIGVDTTPEEVLAEVQALRQEPTKTGRRPSSRQRLALLSGVGLGLIGLFGWWSIAPHTAQSPAPPTVIMSAPQASPRSISIDSNLLVGDASGKVVMLSEVADNQPVRCTFDNQNSAFRQYDPSNAQSLWTLIKNKGEIYVRGRMLRVSPKVFLSDGTDVTNVDDDPLFAVPVTLPLGGFDVVPRVGSQVEFHAINIHLDGYAYEKWQP